MPTNETEAATQDTSWATIYRSAVVLAAVADERQRLRAHQPAPGSTRCQECSGVAPCDAARTATDFLVERGIPPVRVGADDLVRLAGRRRRRAAARRLERRLLGRCPVART
jgi:hypothetical protein